MSFAELFLCLTNIFGQKEAFEVVEGDPGARVHQAVLFIERSLFQSVYFWKLLGIYVELI